MSKQREGGKISSCPTRRSWRNIQDTSLLDSTRMFLMAGALEALVESQDGRLRIIELLNHPKFGTKGSHCLFRVLASEGLWKCVPFPFLLLPLSNFSGCAGTLLLKCLHNHPLVHLLCPGHLPPSGSSGPLAVDRETSPAQREAEAGPGIE